MSTRADLILAVDTSAGAAGLVLAGGGRVDVALLPSRQRGGARTEDLAAETAALLAARGRSARDLTLLGGVVGPGSYTGLRSGLAFLRGLAFADSMPAVAVGTLELLAWCGARAAEDVVVAWPAGGGRHITAAYARSEDAVEELAAPRIMDDRECAGFLGAACRGYAALVVAGCGEAGLADEAGPGPLALAARAAGLEFRTSAPDALAQLALLTAARSRRGQARHVCDLLPIYVGESSARPNRDRVAVLGACE